MMDADADIYLGCDEEYGGVYACRARSPADARDRIAALIAERLGVYDGEQLVVVRLPEIESRVVRIEGLGAEELMR